MTEYNRALWEIVEEQFKQELEVSGKKGKYTVNIDVLFLRSLNRYIFECETRKQAPNKGVIDEGMQELINIANIYRSEMTEDALRSHLRDLWDTNQMSERTGVRNPFETPLKSLKVFLTLLGRLQSKQ